MQQIIFKIYREIQAHEQLCIAILKFTNRKNGTKKNKNIELILHQLFFKINYFRVFKHPFYYYFLEYLHFY